LFGEALGDHDCRDVGEPRRSVGHDRRVDDGEALCAVYISEGVDHGAILWPRAHRAGPDGMREVIRIRADQLR
jgi:hypothetical protein